MQLDPYLTQTCSKWMQISTTKQLCTGMVVGFPWLPAINKLVEAEGVRRGESPMQAFVEDTSGSDLQHAADWTDVDQYLESITERDMNRHVPLLKPRQH